MNNFTMGTLGIFGLIQAFDPIVKDLILLLLVNELIKLNQNFKKWGGLK